MLKKTFFSLVLASFLAPISLLAEPPNPKNPSVYVVQKGDSLWKISKETWGEGSKWSLLYATNQGKIKNPNLIFVGQKIAIPTTITKDQIQKADELAREMAAASESAPAPKTSSKESTSSASEESATSPSKTSKSTSDSTSAAVSAVAEAPTSESAEGFSHVALWVVVVLALVAGAFVVIKMGKSEPPLLQSPRPISQYPQSNPPPSQSSMGSSSPSRPVEPPRTSPAPSARPVDTSVADSYIQQGRFFEAAKIYRAILEKDPGNVEIGKKLIQVENIMKMKSESAAPAQPAPAQPTSAPVEPKPVEPPVQTAPPPAEEPPAVSSSNPPMSSGTITSISSMPPTEPPQSAPPETKPTDESTPPSQGTSSS